MRFRFNKNKSQPEKITKYSIRKFHFGAASVAIASLLFFGNGSVQAADNVVSPATGNPNTHQSEHTTSSGGKASGDSGNAGTSDAPASQPTAPVTPNPATTVETKPEAPKADAPSTPAPAAGEGSSETSTAEGKAVSSDNQSDSAAANEADNADEKDAEQKVAVKDLQTALTDLEDKLSNLEESKKESYKTLVTETDEMVKDHKVTKDKAVKQLERVNAAISEIEKAIKEVEDAKKAAEQKKAEEAKKAQEANQTGTDRSATAESSNRGKPTLAKRALGRRGRPKLAESENTTSNEEAGTLNKETAPKQLPTYKNGADNYKLAEEMREIVKFLKDNGADAAKVAAIKANYDNLNEKLGLTDENAVLSDADFATALSNLTEARNFKEGFLRKNEKNEQPNVLGTERSVGDESSRTERAAGQPRYIKRDSSRDSKDHYNVAKEYYYEDGTKGSSPYDKYTYLFHTFTESLVANNANHSPVRDIKRLVYAEVNEIEGGYSWNITFNAAHEDQQDGYAFFSIPKGQRVENSSINIVKTAQNGNEAEVAGSGDLLNRLKGIHPNSTLTGKEIGIRRNGGREEESLEGLARSSAYAGYYTRRLEGAHGENEKSDNMFNKIADNTQSVYRFQLHGRDTYTISFKTINTNNTKMDKLYYTAGYRVQQWGRRILAQQWHGRHDYDQDDTDRFPLHVVGNGTFLIKQGKHYNTAYPQGAYGFGGYNYDYKPFDADGILGYDASGAYNSNFDMHQYTAPVGSNTPSSNTKATTAGQKFEFYDKEGNKLSASQIGMHGADKPGLVEYKVKRTFTDKSADFLNIKFAIQPKTPTFTENIANSRGQTKNLTVSNGTNGYPITLFREYVENGVTKTEKIATVNANSGGNAVFNNVLIKDGKYYAQSIIPTSAYYDYSNQKHTDVRSEKSTLQEVRADGMAPTIQVGENGKALATTPENNQVTLFVTPSADGKVSLNVQVQDDALGDGMNELSAANNGNVRYKITGAYNNGATTFTKNGGVTGTNGKKDTIKGDLKIQLNQDGGKYKIPNGGLTVTLNATDKVGNKTESATPAKTLTVKVLSAVPNEPPVRMLTGNDVQDGAIKTDVKNQVLESVKNANPDLVRAGVKFEYDTTAGNTDKIKVTYPDGQTRLLTPTKGTKPTKPLVVGPQDGTVSITPQGDTDKVTFSYVPTGQTGSQQVIAKKDGNSWAIQGIRPNGITVDSSTGKITITEPTVKDQSTVTATATFLNSDTSDTAQDTAKNPDRQAPEVWMNGKKLTETATDNKFLVYRGATFNPTFRVEDNSGIIANLSVKNIPNGVWFNKVNNKDLPRTLITNGNYTFSDTVVDQTTPFGTREAIVSVRDANGNAKDYKFQYIIADVLLKNSPESNTGGAKLGDPHRFIATTLNGSTSSDDRYFPTGMTFSWGNNENSETKLPVTSQTLSKEVIATFPANSRNGGTTADGITVYAPESIRKNATINVVDNSKPQATLNGQSLGETATTPIFTVFRGANFNPTIKAWDNSGIIQNISVQSGLPTGVTATPYSGGRQNGKNGATEAAKYSQTLFSGTVANTETLGEHEIALSVKGSDNNDVSTFRFKYRVVDMELKNTYTAEGSTFIGLSNNQSINVAGSTTNIAAEDYLKVVDTENKEDRGKGNLPSGVTYRFQSPRDTNGISSNQADESKSGVKVRMGHYTGGIQVDFRNAENEIANANSTSRTIFTPETITKSVLYSINPSTPKLKKAVEGTAERTTEGELLYGQKDNRPRIEVSNVVPKGEGFGTVNRGSTRYVRLYSSKDPNTFLAEKAVDSNSTSVIFEGSDYAAARPNGLENGEELYAVTRVEHGGVSTLSDASASELVTGRLTINENSTNRIIQANDQTLNDAEKTGIRIALRKANPNLNLSDDNIEITDSGAITITTADKRRGWLQTAPNKDNGAGFVTRFANIRNDYKFENIEGLKVPGRDTDKGFAWSNTTSDNRVNGNRSLIYYYDATKGQSFNFNDALNILNLREGWTVNHTENPSFVATQGVNKLKGERGQDGFSMGPGNTFLKDGNYINVMDVVESSEGGGSTVKKSGTKQVEVGKAGGTGTTLQNVTIEAANGLPGFTLNNVVGGRDSIHKAQVYLRPKWVNPGSLRERNNETKDTTTNVVNLYFVPIDPVKPVVERSDSNELGTSADDAPRLTDTSITASSLVKVTDNYDRDDLGTGATTTSSTGTTGNTATPATGSADPTTGTTLENEVRKRLNVWVKKDGVETQVVRNGEELTKPNGETVLGSLIKTVDPATYELIAKTADTSGNETEKQSLGFFKVGYDLNVRPVINFIQYEKLTDDDKRTLVRVNEGGQLEELPHGATVDVTFETENVNSDYQDKRATATITFANGATTTKVIPYKVYKSFPIANKVYDFVGADKPKAGWFRDDDYYINNGLAGGLTWFIKREVEENGRQVFKDPLPKTNDEKDTFVIPRELTRDIAKGVGEYKYSFGATYPTGRYAATTTDELLKLRREGEIVHTVFDVGANETNKLTVNSGDTLTADQAKAAVMPINGSKELPEGTTYAWVNNTVTGRGGTEVERQVKVTLVADSHGPYAASYPRVKTVTVKVRIKPTKPTVTPDNNGDVRISYNTNETNVNKVEVTYTPADTNRLEDNGDVTKTPQERTKVTATRGTDNQWRITEGAKVGIDVNLTTGEITLKDQVVKDRTQIQAKVAVKEVVQEGGKEVVKELSSDENDSNDSKDGERVIPTIGLNNTLVEVGKAFDLSLGLSDAGVGVDDTNIKVSLPNGETGLTYDATTKSIKGTINAAAKKEITVRVLDKNGNKAEKTISIAAVKVKPIYAIKDGTINNVDTASNFVELPAGLTASWKDNSKPTTTAVGTTNKTVTVNLNGSNVDLTIPVTVYPKAVAKQTSFPTVSERDHNPADGVKHTTPLPKGEDAVNYIQFKNEKNENISKPDNVTVEWERESEPVTTTPNLNQIGRVKITYNNVKITGANGQETSAVEYVDVKVPVLHVTPKKTEVVATFGGNFEAASNNSAIYYDHNGNWTSSVWKSSPGGGWAEYGSYIRRAEKQATNYLGKVKDRIRAYVSDTGSSNWNLYEEFDVTFTVKPVTPTVEGATTGATSLTVNNVNSGTTVELYDVTDTTGTPVKIGEKVVNKEGNYDKKDKISVPLTQGLAAGRKIIAKVVYTSGSDRTESDNSNEIVIKHPKPAAPTISQWQNGNVKVTPDSTNSGDKITIPLTSGSVVVTKDAQNGWQVTGQPNGVSIHNGSIEIPRNLVNTTVTATASKGEGDAEAVSDAGTHTLTTHEVTKADIIKKPTDTIAETDLSRTTGITGVTDNNVHKAYANAGINSVGFTNGKPTLTPDSEQNVPVTITYNDGSKETTSVTLKVAPAAPNVTVNAQDKTTGDVTLTIKRHDNSNYPNDSVVTVHGIDGTFKVKDGTITIKNNQLKDTVQTGKVTVTEKTKLPAETSDDKNIPAKMVDSKEPRITKDSQEKTTGEVTYTVTDSEGHNYPTGAKVTIKGKDYEVTGEGKIKVPNADLPDSTEANVPTKATETGKLPKAGNTVELPAKLTSAKGKPAREFEVEIPLPIVVPDPEHLTSEVKTELEKKVKKSNPNMDVKVDDKGNVTITDPKTGQSKVIPVKDLTVKDFEPVKPTEKVPVKDKAHLTPEEKKQVTDKVKAKNPGKEVTVGDDGTATVTDPTTGISHTIPGTELVNQDFTPVKPEDNGDQHGRDNKPQPVPEVPTDDTERKPEVVTPDEQPAETENTTTKPKASQNILPNTGTAKGVGIFSAAAASILAGLGLIIPVKKEDEKEEETQNNESIQ